MRFTNIIGQKDVKEHLLQMIRQDRIPHALMFCGPQGAGKLPLALAFAQLLLCREHASEEACGQCSDCKMLHQWAHPDLHFSFPVYKAKSTDHPVSDDYLPQWRQQLLSSEYFDNEIWLNDIKAQNQQIQIYVQESDSLQKKLALKSSQGGKKVVIIWQPERMMEATANKLLKFIEEPPMGTHFLLVCQNPDKVIGTILSRVQIVQVPALSENEIAEALIQQKNISTESAKAIAHIAQGSYTSALKRLEESSEEELFLEFFINLMRACYARKIKDMQQWAMQATELGREKQKRFLDYCQRQIRENFIYNFHLPQINYETPKEQMFSTRFAPFINENNVIRIMDELSDASRDIEQNVSARMVFFDLSLKITVLLKH